MIADLSGSDHLYKGWQDHETAECPASPPRSLGVFPQPVSMTGKAVGTPLSTSKRREILTRNHATVIGESINCVFWGSMKASAEKKAKLRSEE